MTTTTTTASNDELTGEPAIWAALVASGVQLAASFWLPWDNGTVAAVNAVVIALAGIWQAIATKATDNGGSIKAALLGFVQAGISLAITFGWHVSDTQTASVMLFVGLLVAAFIRQTSRPKNAPAVAGPAVHIENYPEARP